MKLEKIKEYLSKRIKLKKEKGIDLGCGTGISTLFLKKFCREIYGVDLSRNMLKIASKKLKFKKILKSIENLKIKEKFDIIFCITVLQDNKYPEKLLKVIRKICKRNGIIVISVTKNKGFLYWEKRIRKYLKVKKKIFDEKDFIFVCLK